MQRRFVVAAASLAVAALVSMMMTPSTHAATSVTTIVKTGDVAPGAGGAPFNSFGEAYVGAAGNVTFSGYLDTDSPGIDFNNMEGVWTVANGSMSHYAREGTPVSGKPDSTWTSMVGAGPAGGAHQTVLKAYSTDGRGLFGGVAGNVQPIALTGMQAAGFEPGVTYGDNVAGVNGNFVPTGNAAGQTVFTANTVGGGAGSNAGMWTGSAGNLTLVARYGQQAPGAVEPGATVVHLSDATINDNGQIGFAALLGGTAPAESSGVIYAGAPTALTIVTRTGSVAPGLSGVTIAPPQFGSFGPRVTINNAGHVAFAANLAGADVNSSNDAAIFAGAPAAISVVARKGDAASPALPGLTLDALDSPFLAGNGKVMFMADVAGAGVDTNNDAALFTATANAAKKLIAREGDVIPGATDGAQIRFFDFLGINALGQTHFTAGLKGPGVTFDNDYALFASDPAGNLFTIARTGDQLDLGNGDLRTIESLYIPSYSGGQDGVGTALSEAGVLVFRAGFADGTEGIFSVSAPVPEPSAAFSLLAATALAIRRRRLPV